MYNSTEIANNIKKIAKDKGIVLKTMFCEIGIGENTMSNFKKSMPKVDTLGKIADYLNVSMDYLTGRTEEPTQIMNNSGIFTGGIQAQNYNASAPQITGIESEVLNEMKKMNNKEKAQLLLKACEMTEKEV